MRKTKHVNESGKHSDTAFRKGKPPHKGGYHAGRDKYTGVRKVGFIQTTMNENGDLVTNTVDCPWPRKSLTP